MKVLHRGVTQGEEGTELIKEPEMPALPTNLVRVGSTYKYRSRIPQDLIKFYLPKREVTESLRTKSLAEARRLLPAIQLKYQTEWANLRAALSDHLTELVITDASIAYLSALFEHESLSGDETTRLAKTTPSKKSGNIGNAMPRATSCCAMRRPSATSNASGRPSTSTSS